MRKRNSRRLPIQNTPALPAVNPDIFGRLLPEVDVACDELIRSGVRIPTRETVELMTKRIYDNVVNKYPDMADFARVYDKYFPYVRGETVSMFGVEIKADGAFFGLLAFLLLAGFFFRRRRFRR
jgi:hypothetical protein